MSRAGLQHRIQEQKVLQAWPEVVGKGIAEMTEPIRVINRVLQVKVVNSVWMNELQFHKELILEKMTSRGYAVQELRFFIGAKESRRAESPAEPPKEGKRSDRVLTSEEVFRLNENLSGVKDPEIRDALFRLFSRSLVSRKTQGT